MSGEDDASDDFMALTAAIAEKEPRLSSLAAGILASLSLRIADDTRSFARIFDIEHALVLRALNELDHAEPLVEITRRDGRTQRTFLRLSSKGIRLATESAALS